VPDGDLAVVTEIIDTDTIDVAIGGVTYRVRYIGMDTPERGDYFFTEATEANRALVEGQQVILVKDISETDRFGRLLRYVYLEDGTFVNAELVRQGYAVIATFPPDIRHQVLFLELEREAREAGRGLWAQPVNIEPAPSSPQPTSVPPPTNVPAPAPTNPRPSSLIMIKHVSPSVADGSLIRANQGRVVHWPGGDLTAGSRRSL
jgi:micrococcal nuclease